MSSCASLRFKSCALVCPESDASGVRGPAGAAIACTEDSIGSVLNKAFEPGTTGVGRLVSESVPMLVGAVRSADTSAEDRDSTVESPRAVACTLASSGSSPDQNAAQSREGGSVADVMPTSGSSGTAEIF